MPLAPPPALLLRKLLPVLAASARVLEPARFLEPT